jgi:hypothetical protein
MSTILPHGFIEDDAYSGGEIQTAGALHGYAMALCLVLLQQRLWKTTGLGSKDKIAFLRKLGIPVASRRLCRQVEKRSSRSSNLLLQIFQRLPDPDIDLWPVVKPGAFHLFVIKAESKWFDEMKSGACCQAQPSDRTGVVRNLRLKEDDVEHVEKRVGRRGRGAQTNTSCLFCH